MKDIVIRAEGLSKRYARGLPASGLLRDTLAQALRSPLKAFQRRKRDTFWALKDISLEVKRAEILGLIGRNGSGKTTLLKVLSRITRPTYGWADITGRVGSLLEVGTGFHPELTGRENTYLSGAILGMTKQEIASKFDEIVAFAELEAFIDTAVKHYSSGMYVRLAFSVAAHLDAEILFVDEVLAVGDLRFQRKCLGKMDDAAHSGRTVIMVSHQLNQIRRLCQRVIWLDGGTIRQTGPVGETVSAYEASMASSLEDENRPVRGRAEFLSWKLAGANGVSEHVLHSGGQTVVTFVLRVNDALRGVHQGVTLYDQSTHPLWSTTLEGLFLEPGLYEFRYTLPSLPLRPGVYTWRIGIYDSNERVDDWECHPRMQVATPPQTQTRDEIAGCLNIPATLDVLPLPNR